MDCETFDHLTASLELDLNDLETYEISVAKMTEAEYELPETINPNNFPAKLWCMVNNPSNSAICWANTGQAIVIDQHLFEKLVLSPCKEEDGNSDSFKTTRFTSFVRQLNLYGFRKAKTLSCTASFDDDGFKSPKRPNMIHHFFNPNFRRDNPALLIHLKRLTVANKAKMDCGSDVKCQPPSKSLCEFDEEEEDGSEKHLMKGEARKMAPLTYYNNKKMLLPAHDGAPVAPRHMAQQHVVPSLEHSYSALLFPALQESMRYNINYATPNLTGIHSPNEQFHPGFYSSTYQCYQPPFIPMPNGPFPPIHYYSTLYTLNLGRQEQEQNMKNYENQNSDVTDRVFQMADEIMPNPPNNTLIEIVSPERESCFPAGGYPPGNVPHSKAVLLSPSAVSPSGDAPDHTHSKMHEFVEETAQFKAEVIHVSKSSGSEFCEGQKVQKDM